MRGADPFRAKLPDQCSGRNTRVGGSLPRAFGVGGQAATQVPSCNLPEAPSQRPAADVQMWKKRGRDRKQRARLRGSTHFLATDSAITAEGKRVGHVQTP